MTPTIIVKPTSADGEYIAQCLRKLERNDEALLTAEKAIDIEPKNISGWLSAGWCAYELENYDKANNYFESAFSKR